MIDPMVLLGQTPAGEPVLRTRFAIPAPPADLVVRDRLLDAMSQGVQAPLTLVSAPAGSGKTVLVSSWLERRAAPGPVLWMTMDRGDERSGVFWSYVLAGLRRVGVEVGDADELGRAEAGGRLPLDRLAASLAERDEPVVVVLDDGDYLVDRTLGGDLGYLLRHCDGRLRVVLVTRTDPALPLHRYRLDGTITEVRAVDLAFDRAETSELLERFGLDLGASDLSALLERTAGWSAGLKFAAMALVGRSDSSQAIRDFTGDDGDVAAYLVSEVLDAQPPQLREVLLRTSIVDQLEPGLLEALTGHPVGQRTLEFMARGNSFIQPVDGCHGYYRYQSLFREFLRAQLRYEQPELVPCLHGLAADWLAGQERAGEALEHAVAAGAWADAARYVVDDLGIGALISGCRGAVVSSLFATLPDDVPGVEACLVRAAQAVAVGDLGRCAAELAQARAWCDAQPRRPSLGRELSLALLDALVSVRTAEVAAGGAALALADHLLSSAPVPAVAAHPELTAMVAGCHGELLLLQGDPESAEVALARAFGAADAPGCEALMAHLLGAGALAAAVNGHLRRALELADRSDAAARSGAVVGVGSGSASAARSWARMEQYDLDAARHVVVGAEAVARTGDPVVAAVLALVRARLLRADGDLEGALRALRATREASPDEAGPAWLASWLGAAEADLLVAQGLPDEAVAVVERLGDPTRPESVVALQLARFARGEVDPVWTSTVHGVDERAPLEERVGALLVQAARRAGAGDPARARATVERALRLAAPERLRRPFREASPAVRRMLRVGGDLASRYPWLHAGAGAEVVAMSGARPLAAGSGGGTRRPYADGRTSTPGTDAIVDPLTKKEREVLGHLADLLSTDEIAGAMFVSVNTVRTHVRSILRKLGAARRNEAIRRAWELGLLPVPGDVSPKTARLAQSPLAR